MNIAPIVAAESSPASTGTRPAPGKIRDAATQFEALLLTQMLRSARAGDQTQSMDGSDANSSLIEMSEQQFAQALASSGGLGIAKMVMAGLDSHANR